MDARGFLVSKISYSHRVVFGSISYRNGINTSTGGTPVGEPVETTDHYGNYDKLIRSKKGDLQNEEYKIFQVL